MQYKIVNVHDISKNKEDYIYNTKEDYYQYRSEFWYEFQMLPYYSDLYWGLSSRKDFVFDELWNDFIHGNSESQIGSISIISYNFSDQLLERVKNIERIDRKKLLFLIRYVVPDFLPIIFNRKEIFSYSIPEEFTEDKWVQILQLIKIRLISN